MLKALKIVDDGEKLKLVPAFGPEPSQALIGRTRQEVMTLLPLIFNLCPSAHRLAAAKALNGPIEAVWPRALAEETLIEHVLVMVRDWPCAFGVAPNLTALRGLRPLKDERLLRLKREVFSEETRAFIKTVHDWPANWGFYASSEVDTAFARQIEQDALIAKEVDRLGPVLWLRLWARYREARKLLDDLLEERDFCACGISDAGAGWAHAARGKLYHQASLNHEKIESYTIISPTQRLMAQGGQAQQMLNTVPQTPLSLRETVAKIIMSALDPCVEVTYVPAGREAVHHA